MVIDLPTKASFAEIPANENLTFLKMTYSLTYKKASDTQLKIERRFHSDRNTIAVADYPAFRNFIERIVKAEHKMIAYK